MYTYKGVWPRFFAALIDGIIVGIPMSVVMYAVVGGGSSADTMSAMSGSSTLMAIISLAYYILLEAGGGTLGKRILGMRIIDENGNKPGFGKSLVRNLLRIVDAIPGFYLVGILVVAGSHTKQRVGDKAAKTFVVAK